MSIERSLENIADKAALHAWIDSIPEGAKGVVLLEHGDFHNAMTFGTPEASTIVWLMRSYEHRLITRNTG